MAIYQLGTLIPQIDPTAFIFDSADIIGDVVIEAQASIWAHVSIRGDNTRITIGHHANVQEGCVLHSDTGSPLLIEHHVTVGHQAMLHGCTVGSGSLIGMQAIVLNNAKIGRDCLIAAGAIIPEGREIPDGSLVIGVGKIVRALSDEEIADIRQNIEHYALRGQMYRQELKRLGKD
jgi:carbonic anhydrase/acetyltransferase-like protein (isoleucine patch superfamily)